MQALTFWKMITADHSNLLEQFLDLLTQNHIRYCVIGGQAVNAYTEPVVSLDLDIVVAIDQVELLESLVRDQFVVKAFPNSLNITLPDSDLRVLIHTDPRYAAYPDRSALKNVLGMILPVAGVEDVLRGKIWAVQDPQRRGSKRQKDVADIARLIEVHTEFRPLVPDEIIARLL
ncbi:MAG: hypothetical protein M1434_06135 [Chloroflexi bacterium]|nr:hypothetical protein [Chloroflexota bacterium]MCL5274313.1 hypothetical protein [Chloroflexota bacterium]